MKASRAGHTCTVRYLISKGKNQILILCNWLFIVF
jgi:hypothetical protein